MTEPNDEIERTPLVVTCPFCININELNRQRFILNKTIRDTFTGKYKKLFKAYSENLKMMHAIREEIKKLPKKCDRSQLELKGNFKKQLYKLTFKGSRLKDKIKIIENEAYNHTEDGRKYKILSSKHRGALQSHPKCSGCQLLFGNYHLAK